MIAKWGACLVLVLWFTQAAAQSPREGEYIRVDRQGWWSVLALRAPVNGGQAFSIDSAGSNGHECHVEGLLHGRRADVAAGSGETCTIDVWRLRKGWEVDSGHTPACRLFCGFRADFDGLYLRVPEACTRTEMHRTRDSFIRLYRRREYDLALRTLEPLLADCEPMLYYVQAGNVRNDLSVTLYHLGQRDACLRVLAPLRALAQTSDAEILGRPGGVDADNNVEIAKKARTNLRLCEGLQPAK